MNNLTPIIFPALEIAQRSLLSPSSNDLISSNVASIAKEAQGILAISGLDAAMAHLTSKLKFEQANFFSRNKFAVVSASVNELITQAQGVEYGVSNIDKRAFPADALVYGVQLQFCFAATATALSNVAYNNLTAVITAAVQNGEFDFIYGGRVVFNELIRQFIYDNTVKTDPEFKQYYPLAAPILIKEGGLVNPVIKLGTAYTAGGTDALYTNVVFKSIKITVRQ